jgi:hypothetical protein
MTELTKEGRGQKKKIDQLQKATSAALRPGISSGSIVPPGRRNHSHSHITRMTTEYDSSRKDHCYDPSSPSLPRTRAKRRAYWIGLLASDSFHLHSASTNTNYCPCRFLFGTFSPPPPPFPLGAEIDPCRPMIHRPIRTDLMRKLSDESYCWMPRPLSESENTVGHGRDMIKLAIRFLPIGWVH